MKIEFKNRYGCNIYFEKLDNNTVVMSGYESDMLRYSWSEDGYKAIDPSGGPFIQTGDNLKMYFNVDEDMFISDIIFNKGHVVFILKDGNQTPKNQDSSNEG